MPALGSLSFHFSLMALIALSLCASGNAADTSRLSTATPSALTTRTVSDLDVEKTTVTGPTVAHRWQSAISNDDIATLQRLLNSADAIEVDRLVTSRASNGKSALMVAAKLGDRALLNQLLAAGASVNERTLTDGSPLMFAVLGNQHTVARQLLELGADLDAEGSNGWSAMMIAAARGHAEMVAWLIEQGATVDREDVYQLTPLMRAVDNAHLPAVQILLEAGKADANHIDESGSTALHYAVAAERMELVQLLMRHGAIPTLPNRAGISPRQLAEGKQELLRLLR